MARCDALYTANSGHALGSSPLLHSLVELLLAVRPHPHLRLLPAALSLRPSLCGRPVTWFLRELLLADALGSSLQTGHCHQCGHEGGSC